MLNETSTDGTVIIIGAGVMGTGIAALMANLGWSVSLLDRLPDEPGTDQQSRNRIARDGLDQALKSRPPQFALPELAANIRTGNVDDHLEWCREADWVVEAVAENSAVKRSLLAKIAEACGKYTVVSSNTSGLSLADMVADCPPDFRSRFFGTHFFNPPRYMKPLELISQVDTDPAVFDGFALFADHVLGKRVIRAKDTPGFISTRLGITGVVQTIALGVKYGFDPEFVDYVTGPLIGRPKTGTYRLTDLIGLDITSSIMVNLARDLPLDRRISEFEMPDVVATLVQAGRTGTKAGAGFYKRDQGGEILSLDSTVMEYRPLRPYKRFPAEVEELSLPKRLRALWDLSGTLEFDAGFLQDLIRTTIGYMADVTPEVADRIVEVDDAMIGGFGWEAGPFHMLDMLGDVDWQGSEPATVRMLRESGLSRFYENTSGEHFYFDFGTGKMAGLPRPTGVTVLKDLKRAGRTVEETELGSLVDLGDGVLCAEWRTKMCTLDPEVARFLDRARVKAEAEFSALVLGGASAHFSAGFNLALLAGKMEANDWNWIDATMRDLQMVLHRMRYASVPVVAAVSGFALGGGCEVAMHASVIQAAFESSIGLPEANVGLMPVAGGVAQSLLRAMENVTDGTILEPTDPYPTVKPVWDNLRTAKFSGSALEARNLGFLRSTDGMSVHPDRLLHDAKKRAISLAVSYSPPEPVAITVMAEPGLARFRWNIQNMLIGRQITDHDALIADRLAWVLCGGTLKHRAEVTEAYLLELEREAFLTLCSTEKSLARIMHLLETGKPLKN